MSERRALPRPDWIDSCANLLLGEHGAEHRLPPADGSGPRAALERAMLPALARPPCLVSFSGGRDSSAVLALARATARRHGLAEPIPAILRFPGVPQADESRWQQRVLSHLELANQEVVELHHELDALGPAAVEVLQRDGLLWPANAYMHRPILELASGGSLLTGIGGDELLGSTASRHVWLLRGRSRPRRSDAKEVAWAALPRPARAALWRRRKAPGYPWMRPAAHRELVHALGEEEHSWPHRWDLAVHHWHRSRAYAALDGALARVAPEQDVLVVNPLLDPAVLAELAQLAGPTGFAGREEAMRTLFGDLLPDEILVRVAKAGFSAPVWGPAVREFAESWDGAGLPEDRVDGAALRREWLSEKPDFRTVLLLHRAWLHSRGQPSAASS